LIESTRDGTGARLRCRLGLLAVGIATLTLALCGCDSAKHATSAGTSTQSYGTLPSFLPTSSIDPDGVLTGATARPALTTEGDAVMVRLADASIRATVDGPEVPGEGLPYQTPATTCTWTVTLSGATSTVPIVIGDFSTLDHLGVVYHVATVPGQPAPPAALAPGQTASFELRTVMPTGEGLMRWAPDGGPIVAEWDFEVEND
jgi:hypothetical protein